MSNKQNTPLRIAIAQQNFLLGDIHGNTIKIIETAKKARKQLAADLIIFPELAITGYPPEDLLLRDELHQRVALALQQIQQNITDIYIVVGHPEKKGEQIYNAASVIFNQQRLAVYYKCHLPNYSVFDEKRYFSAGHAPCVFTINQTKIGVVICEDLWHAGPLEATVSAGAELVLSLNSSPFYFRKQPERLQLLQERQKIEGHVPIIYVNCVGGQDELVFDGGSFAINGKGQLCYAAPTYEETLAVVTVEVTGHPTLQKNTIAADLSDEASLYDALVLGTRDYIQKNNFPGALIGLSGGIDSALTLAIAVDAIGADKVHAVLMPSRYTAAMSVEDARLEAEKLQVKYSIISIEDAFNAFLKSLSSINVAGITAENLQARCRGVILMALSNSSGSIVLTTGNKSEMAIGYATLYGDMAGGFAVLKDVLKTWVYRLANYRNRLSNVIPERVIQRPPSAELAENQTDQDTLPPYDILDQIISAYVEQDESQETIIKRGFDAEIVTKVIRFINRNEYKRRQAAPGIKITSRAFGRDWRYPITSKFGG